VAIHDRITTQQETSGPDRLSAAHFLFFIRRIARAGVDKILDSR
jgi:hypothetical protein